MTTLTPGISVPEDLEKDKSTILPPPRECSSTSDFVIREGFPALRLPNGGGRPWIEGVEPLPRLSFWAHETALHWPDVATLDNLRIDCETVFSARTRQDGQPYSAGITYFSPCQMKPRCALEELVLDIFCKHTEHLPDDIFVPEQSGAEWWTLVLEEEKEDNSNNNTSSNEDDDAEGSDEVGMHFDADYGLEDQAPNLLLHPRLATVTYLSDCGTPTVILHQRSPPPDDVDKKTLQGDVCTAWISHPRVGKHIAFDGRLLHGAPATFFPGRTNMKSCPKYLDVNQPGEPPSKKLKIMDAQIEKRYTLLVNVWLNHCPLDAEPLDDDVLAKLVTPWKNSAADTSKKGHSAKPDFYTWNDFAPSTRSSDSCQKVHLKASQSDPAGEEEVILCSRLVTVKYGATMEAFHQASREATLVELELGKGVLSLHVGDIVSKEESTDEEGDDDDNEEDVEQNS
jgi:hypothetical protein